MNVIIHIGSDKTGTTSIQSTLDLNREKLKKLGVLYPKLDQSNHHHELVKELIANKPGHHWQQLQQRLKTNFTHIIISSEMLCSTKEEHIERLKQWLSPHTVSIICYIRRADEYLESGIYQRLKSSNSKEEFFRTLNKGKRTPFLFNKNVYIAALKCRFVFNWGKHFPEHMIVRPYDWNSWTNNSLIEDFFIQTGIHHNPSALNLLSDTKNITPDLSVVYAMHLLSKTSVPWIKHNFSEIMTHEFNQKKTTSTFSYWQRSFAQVIASISEKKLKKKYNLHFTPKKINKSQANLKPFNITASAAEHLSVFIAHSKIKAHKKQQTHKKPDYRN